MIQRAMSNVIMRDVASYPVIAVLGPRQSGKTTLVRALFPDMAYANLEDPPTREFAISDPSRFLSDRSGGLVIDEFQRASELLSYIPAVIE